ncbi:hypothetical protein OG948_56875 (plasmid) [Embleya sp. NBC_00888]|uniref:hypothetical protein n=1 Tax=Embleya sp. NBC_00888 TaxID=2975960 RepID=UPI002F90D0C0|nr:hypothetical protein OG948_56875 [Embleya sp. NBC_00888]
MFGASVGLGPQGPAVEEALRGARVLAHEYDDLDVVAAREYLARERADTPTTLEANRLGPGGSTLSRHERAAREPGSTDAMFLAFPHAVHRLSRLVNDRRIEPRGALVFACLLHITGREEGSGFRWCFAAGAGSHTAAYRLYLDHRTRGEIRDAHHWLARSHHLARTPAAVDPHDARDLPLLPEDARAAILEQCRRGDLPRLPHALEAVVHRLRVEDDDEDYGDSPTRRRPPPRPRRSRDRLRLIEVPAR